MEREPLTLSVQAKDPDAPVTFYLAGKKVTPDDGRCEVRNMGNGLHTLVVGNLKMSDLGTLEARTPSNRGEEVRFDTDSFFEDGEGLMSDIFLFL